MAGNFFGGLFFGGGFFGAVTPSGVRGKGLKRELVVRLSDVKNREDTAEFLKNQLRLRHPGSAFEDTSAQDQEKERRRLAKQARREKEMRLRAEREAAMFAKDAVALEAEQKAKAIKDANNMKILLLLGSAV